MKNQTNIVLAAALLTLGANAFAQSAGSWSASVGVTHIAPAVDSGNLTSIPQHGTLANTQIDVNSNTQLTGAVNYMVTDHIGLHLPLGTGFKHEVSGAGAIAGVGKLVDTKALPVTLIAQYRFKEANAVFRPYVGAGLSYVKFYNEKGTALLTALTTPGGAATGVSFESKLAPTLQLGGVFKLNEKWYLDASYCKTLLKTRATLTTGQTIDVKLNPDSYTLQVGYRF
jgi:outer membrane protein